MLLGLAALPGCGSSGVPAQVLLHRCQLFGGSTPTLKVPIAPSDGGLLAVQVDERGITVTARFEDSPTSESTSPVERLGRIVLARQRAAGTGSSVRITSRDSPDVTGEVCVSAERTSAQAAAGQAALHLAAASAASQQREWREAFKEYAAGARLLDGLGRGRDAVVTRHAMARLGYGPLRLRREAMALEAATLAVPDEEPALRGARLLLLAEVLMELPPETRPPALSTTALLSSATTLFKLSPLGARELPRLTIIAGYEQYQLGHIEAGERLWGPAAATCRALKDWQCFGLAQQNLAVVAEERQNYPAALSAYDEALRPLDPERAPQLAADIFTNLGRLQNRAGLVILSEQSLRTAMRLYAHIGQCDGVRNSAMSIGDMLVHAGSIADASTYLEPVIALGCPELLRLAGTPGTPFEARRTARAEPGSNTRRFACAERPRLTELSPDGTDAVFFALETLAEAAELEGELGHAEACLELAQGYTTNARQQVDLENARGNLLLEQNRSRDAEAAFLAAQKAADAAGDPELSDVRGIAQLGLAKSALQVGEQATARSRASQALRLGSARADVNQVVSALRILASVDEQDGHAERAAQTLRIGARLLEQVPTQELDAERRASYLATQHAVFAELSELLAGRSSARAAPPADELPEWQAFATAEEGRARSVRLAREQSTRERAGAQQASGSNDYRLLLRDLAALAQEDSLIGAGGLLEQIGGLRQLREPVESTLNRAELVARLRAEHAVLVEYVAGPHRMFAFVADADQLHVVDLGAREPIAAAALQLREQLRAAETDVASVRASARTLASLVLWPIRSHLTRERMVFVADDALNTIPFALLPWSSEGATDLLVHHAELTSVPSAFLFAQAQRSGGRAPGGERYVLLGDPVFRGNLWQRNCAHNAGTLSEPLRVAFQWARDLPSLPGSRREVLDVAQVLEANRPGAMMELLLGCDATPSALRAQALNSTLLHIATHGLVDARRPRLSALALTPDPSPPDEAAFRLLDILELKLRARLVVLSACDTSRGRLLPGEGVLGLAQAFLEAGAESVVASYWRVEDGATAPFMVRFYRYLLVDRLPAATALRRTQLDEAADAHSFAWAAFTLYGGSSASL
jgi:CHAT domain-containing protein